MARLNSILALLCLSLPIQAQDIFPGPIMRTIAGAGGGGSGCPTCLVSQDFEGAGYDNGETWTESGTATIDEDYTGVVLAGSQSLRIVYVSNLGAASTSFSANDDIWIYCLIRPIAIHSATRNLIEVLNNTTTLGLARITSGGAIVASATATATTVATMSTGTTYHLWVHYVKGSGANSVLSVAFSTDGVRPTSGDNFAGVATGPAVLQADKIALGSVASTVTAAEYIYDKVRVDDAQIGDNPP
jgi:hypothetical protein